MNPISDMIKALNNALETHGHPRIADAQVAVLTDGARTDEAIELIDALVEQYGLADALRGDMVEAVLEIALDRDVMEGRYEAWVEEQGLPMEDAESLIHGTLTAYQRQWLSAFIAQWDAMEQLEAGR